LLTGLEGLKLPEPHSLPYLKREGKKVRLARGVSFYSQNDEVLKNHVARELEQKTADYSATKSAKLPLSQWTSYGVTVESVKKRLLNL
jgi:hypothetical protein